MKKFLSILLSLSLVISLAGCGAPASGESTSDSSESTVTESESTTESTSQSESVADSTTETGLPNPWGIEIAPMTGGSEYDYETICYQDKSLDTIGRVFIHSYTVNPDGYGRVDKTLRLQFEFSDDNAWYNGMSYGTIYADRNDETFVNGDSDSELTIDNSEETVVITRDEFIYGEWVGDKFIAQYELSLNTPEDYNNIVVIMVDYGNVQDKLDADGNYIDGFKLADITNPDTPWFVFDCNAVADSGNYWMEEDTAGGDMSDTPMIELLGWDADVLDADGVTTVNFDTVMYNVNPGDYIIAEAYIDGTQGPVQNIRFDNQYMVHSSYNTLTFEINGSLFDGTSVNFKFWLYSSDGTELSATQMDIPFGEVENEQQDGTDSVETDDGTLKIMIDGPTFESDGFSFDVTVKNWQAGQQMWCLVYEPGAENLLHEINYEIMSDDHSFGFDFIADDIEGNEIILEFVVSSADGQALCTETTGMIFD